MPLDLKEEIGKGQTIVLIIPNEQYTKKIIEITKYFSDNHKSICYVSLNKLFDPLIASFKDAGVDQNKFFFVDAITKSTNPNIKESDNCIYISSPSSLTELSIAINKVLETGKFEGFLLDSLSTLLIYNKSEVVCKFVHGLINKMKGANATVVFTALKGDTGSILLKDIGMFVDNVLPYG